MIRATALAAAVSLMLTGGAFAAANGGGNNSKSNGLVNVTLGDVVLSEIAKDLNVNVSDINPTVQVPVGIAANVCGVEANVIAQAKGDDTYSCTATSSSQALTQIVQRGLTNQQ